MREVPLDSILPNPYQTRQEDDREHVENLADSIRLHGLLQIPTARVCPDDAEKVQLAFGHSRLAALKLLREQMPATFLTMPLNVAVLDDLQMFEMAVTENRERKDLTPTEEALAMARYRDEFKKTSEEIGTLFHLSASAVRNKLRLLDLPQEVQAKVGHGITEGAARELLVYEGLPDAVKEHKFYPNNSYGIEGFRHHQPLRQHIADAIGANASQEVLNVLISDAIDRAGELLDKKRWKHDEVLHDAEGKIHGACKGCAFLMQRDGQEMCLDAACFDAKERAWKRQYLSQASLLGGIAVLEEEREGWSEHTEFNYNQTVDAEQIQKIGCENLRLRFSEVGGYQPDERKRILRPVDGFEDAEVVCCKKRGYCTCLKAAEKGVDVSTETQAPRSEEDLKELRRQMKVKEKLEKQAIEHLLKMASIAVQKELDAQNVKAWAAVLSGSNLYRLSSQIKEVNTFRDFTACLADLFFAGSGYSGTKEGTLRHLNESLQDRFNLPPLDISFGEPEKPQGKTLTEVFEDDAPVAKDLDPGEWKDPDGVKVANNMCQYPGHEHPLDGTTEAGASRMYSDPDHGIQGAKRLCERHYRVHILKYHPDSIMAIRIRKQLEEEKSQKEA